MRVAVLLSSAVLLVATAAAAATAGDAVREPVDGLAADADADAALVLQRARAVLYGLLEERASSLSSSSPARALATSSNDNNAAGLWMIAETDEVWRDAAGPVGCAACEAILAQLKIVAAAGDAFFIRFLTELCKRTRIQDDDVCAGSIALEGPIVARGIRDVGIGSKASRLFCVHALGLCEYPDVEEWKVPFPSESPPPTPSPPPPSSSPSLKSQDVEKKPLYIVHYSDVHVDPFYEQGANANCTKPICCRNYPDSVIDDNFLPAGPHGDHKCDPPISLEESMYAAIRELVPDASFSIFTGDIVDHAVWNTTQAQNTVDIDASYIRMADIVGIPVYGAAGNHESSPTNSFPPEGTDDSAQWLYDVLSLTWVRWVGPDAADTVRRLGAYSTKLADMNLRIISLNTNLHYAQNYWLYEDPMQRDPSGQLAWLVGELDAAEQSGERVYIIGHMPMGSVDAFHDGSNYFDQIARRYSPGTIAGLFFGHTHLDEFQVAYRDYGSRSHEGAFATTYIAPSLTPMSGHPSFRVYTVDPETFGVLDMTSYRADMSLPDFQGSPQWEKYYSAREAYGPLVSPPLGDGDELTPAFWHDVTEVLERNATAFGEYLGRKRRGWLADEVVAACDESCARLEICKLRGARAQDNCMRPAPQVKSAGTSEPSLLPAEDDECEGSVLRSVLGSVGVQRELLSLGALDGSGADMERRPGDDEMSEL